MSNGHCSQKPNFFFICSLNTYRKRWRLRRTGKRERDTSMGDRPRALGTRAKRRGQTGTLRYVEEGRIKHNAGCNKTSFPTRANALHGTRRTCVATPLTVILFYCIHRCIFFFFSTVLDITLSTLRYTPLVGLAFLLQIMSRIRCLASLSVGSLRFCPTTKQKPKSFIHPRFVKEIPEAEDR